jgi:tungstate transport system permease protein
MNLGEAFRSAFHLLFTLDPQVLSAVGVSLKVSALATLLATILGSPIGFLVAAREFRGRRIVELGLKTATAMPTVVVGLITYAMLSRSGPLGMLGLLYTPVAIVIGETILVTPLMAALTMAVVSGADPRIEETALTLGASRVVAALTVLVEMKLGILAAVAAGFGRVISELGIALMVGGNIAGVTRTTTTAIALETAKGEFALGFALGSILLAAALLVNLGVILVTARR